MTKLIIALDNLSIEETKEKIRDIEQHFKESEIIFKVNDLLALVGFEGLFSIFQNSKAFLMLDAKYHDIENTMKNYLKQLATSKIAKKVSILTVHTSIGKKALQELKKLRDELGFHNLKIFSITALTSLDDEETMELYGKNAKELVLHFAKIAFDAGIDGIVCSAQEVAMIKQIFGKDFLVLTPGVRLKKTDNTDQKRIATVEETVENGSDYIVMGRPVLNSPDMIGYIKNILNIINK